MTVTQQHMLASEPILTFKKYPGHSVCPNKQAIMHCRKFSINVQTPMFNLLRVSWKIITGALNCLISAVQSWRRLLVALHLLVFGLHCHRYCINDWTWLRLSCTHDIHTAHSVYECTTEWEGLWTSNLFLNIFGTFRWFDLKNFWLMLLSSLQHSRPHQRRGEQH